MLAESGAVRRERVGFPRFTDQESDRETDLLYYGARYYDPWVGRFLSQDPALIGPYPGVTFRRLELSSQALNAYSYVENRPTILVDPTGAYVDSLSRLEHEAMGTSCGRCGAVNDVSSLSNVGGSSSTGGSTTGGRGNGNQSAANDSAAHAATGATADNLAIDKTAAAGAGAAVTNQPITPAMFDAEAKADVRSRVGKFLIFSVLSNIAEQAGRNAEPGPLRDGALTAAGVLRVFSGVQAIALGAGLLSAGLVEVAAGVATGNPGVVGMGAATIAAGNVINLTGWREAASGANLLREGAGGSP